MTSFRKKMSLVVLGNFNYISRKSTFYGKIHFIRNLACISKN